jgi:hypothetical protein
MVMFLAVFPLSNILCFLIGARVGQKVVKGEEVELPKIDPMKAARERQDRKEAEKEQERIDAIMRNIDTYNGSAEGQTDIPVR